MHQKYLVQRTAPFQFCTLQLLREQPVLSIMPFGLSMENLVKPYVIEMKHMAWDLKIWLNVEISRAVWVQHGCKSSSAAVTRYLFQLLVVFVFHCDGAEYVLSQRAILATEDGKENLTYFLEHNFRFSKLFCALPMLMFLIYQNLHRSTQFLLICTRQNYY